jgi:hypothetical protein
VAFCGGDRGVALTITLVTAEAPAPARPTASTSINFSRMTRRERCGRAAKANSV